MATKSICLYFQVHQPDRLRLFRFFDIGADDHYFDDFENSAIVRRVAARCYLPANRLIKEMIEAGGKKFKVTFSISGTAIEQFKRFAPEVMQSFRELADTGCVEFLAETYAHSLASLSSPAEFKEQVKLHAKTIETEFGVKPKAFRNTELIYSDAIGEMVASMGYRTMLTEGAKHILGWKSPGFVYHNPLNPKLNLLLKNSSLSDDIAFRFSNRGWSEWPLTADKYAGWIADVLQNDDIVNLFMDYETFGEHQKAESGIFDFLKALPSEIAKYPDICFCTASEAAKRHKSVGEVNVPFPISWADEERDTSAWLGNELQNEAFSKLNALEGPVKKCGDAHLLATFRRLQESDHLYYMCTKFFSDGAVHSYFNPYDTPYEAFINYMNVLSDFEIRVEEKSKKKQSAKH